MMKLLTSPRPGDVSKDSFSAVKRSDLLTHAEDKTLAYDERIEGGTESCHTLSHTTCKHT